MQRPWTGVSYQSTRAAQGVGRLASAFLLFAGLSVNAATPKAVFILVDGIPADLVESVTTPFFDEIAGVGGYTRAYVGGQVGGASESPTVSAVGYNSLLTGTWANKHKVYSNQIRNPDYQYWDIFRAVKQHDPELKTAIFSTWEDNRTKLLGHGLPEAGGDKLDYYFDGFENDVQQFPHDEGREFIREIDDLVSREAARYILERGPDLSWVYLEFTDDIGHLYGDGVEMASAITLMDANVGRIWRSVQARQLTEDENWLVVITTDHGRDAETGKGHGGQSDRERTIWIVTNGTTLNENFTNLPSIVDILPSVLTHLQVAVPQAVRDQFDGKSFIDEHRQ
ncbi:MAG: nucleotide pyrophosphatase [Gammaproteobacteria bacterium]|nr:nucleotide pyrophosphatase [Gammaproteobacteria bacterium]HBW83999.1 nucleotide pyrophosphatase [Gammaproteobacteria bacterium]|tara:strand:- start:1466 stop:2482 length:1017 start_codon:yes stop_codon:yes gene_type:complete